MGQRVTLDVVENGFKLDVTVWGRNDDENRNAEYVYTKPSQVVKAFKEIMKPFMPPRKPRAAKTTELKVGE